MVNFCDSYGKHVSIEWLVNCQEKIVLAFITCLTFYFCWIGDIINDIMEACMSNGSTLNSWSHDVFDMDGRRMEHEGLIKRIRNGLRNKHVI